MTNVNGGYLAPMPKQLKKDAYNYIDPKYLEGRCGICESEGVYVMTVEMPVCNHCASRKIGKEHIQGMKSYKPHGWCYYRGHYAKRRYRFNIADIKFNTCYKCFKRMCKNGYFYEDHGYQGTNPRYVRRRKRYGKDVNKILEMDLTKDERKRIRHALGIKRPRGY